MRDEQVSEGHRTHEVETEGINSIIVEAVGLFSLGMIGGIYGVCRYEKVKLTNHLHVKPGVVALKALVAGTVLCIGAFGVGGSLFVKATGIDTLEKFKVAGKALVQPISKEPSPSEQATNDKQYTELEKYVTDMLKIDEKLLPNPMDLPKSENNKNSENTRTTEWILQLFGLIPKTKTEVVAATKVEAKEQPADFAKSIEDDDDDDDDDDDEEE